MRLDITRSKVYNEFNKVDKYKHFYVKDKAVIHNIDTLYYSVDVVTNSKGFLVFIEQLEEAKENENLFIPLVQDIKFSEKGFAGGIYRYCLTIENEYDIFISKKTPNEATPNILVQLRSIGLWTIGYKESLIKSFGDLLTILTAYDIQIKRDVLINRIDYAYHTNLIQSMEKYLHDSKIIRYLSSNLKLACKVFNLEERKIDISYLSIGNKKSNNVFFRMYNKSREVIEKNYKYIFLETWKQNGLISEYDLYCYNVAYRYGTYNALDVGKLFWYIEHGNDIKLREQCVIAVSCFEATGKYELARKVADEYFPKVTLITNIEYMVKRKFIDKINEGASKFDDLGADERVPYLNGCLKILKNGGTITRYLKTNTVRFNMKWWDRILSCDSPAGTELKRDYIRKLNLEAIKRRLLDNFATNSVYTHEKVSGEFHKDVEDALMSINDNDMRVYERTKEKKYKQVKYILNKMSPEDEI